MAVQSVPTIPTRLDIDEALFSPEAMAEFVNHVWSRQCSELANVIEHATILCEKPPILPEHLPRHITDRRLRKEQRAFGPLSAKRI